MANSIFVTPFGGTIVAGGSVAVDSVILDSANQDVVLIRDAANTLALRNGANEQTIRIGPSSTYASLASAAGDLRIGVNSTAYTHYLTSGGQLLTQANAGFGLTVPAMVRTAPTISSGFGTSPSIASNNGTVAFTVNVGTGGAASSGVIGLPTATNGWVLNCVDITNPASSVTTQVAGTVSGATIANYSRTTGLLTAWAASDIIRITAMAY